MVIFISASLCGNPGLSQDVRLGFPPATDYAPDRPMLDLVSASGAAKPGGLSVIISPRGFRAGATPEGAGARVERRR
jgi:hypothetical protein